MQASLERLLTKLNVNSNNMRWNYYYQGSDHILTESYPHMQKAEDIIILTGTTDASVQPMHRHESFVLNYLLSGNVVIETEHEVCSMHAGDLFLSQPHTPHTCRFSVCSAETPLMLTILVRKELLSRSFLPFLPEGEIFRFLTQPYDEPHSEEYLFITGCGDEDLQTAFLHIVQEYVEQPPFYEQMLVCTLLTCLGLIARRLAQQISELTQEQLLMQDILKYITEHCDTVTLQDTARVFNYNANYLSTLIHRETTQCFSQLVRACRLEKAQGLLCTSDLPITKISRLTGYAHPSNFYKVFKSEYGISPAEFRRNRRTA